MPKFPNWGTGTAVSGTNLANVVPNIVTKASTTSITSNTTLANDSELSGIALEIGTWEIEVLIWATGAAAGAGNLKTDWSFTGTLTGTPNRSTLGPASTSTAAHTAITTANYGVAAYNAANTYGLASTTVFCRIFEECPNFVVSAAGNFGLRVAQGTSNATATVVQAGSRVKCRRIA